MHGTNISVDLGLDVKLHSLAGTLSTSAQTPKQMLFAFRCARTDLLILQRERSIAFLNGPVAVSRSSELPSFRHPLFCRH